MTRFRSKASSPQYVVNGETGCWEWAWSLLPSGYGQVWVKDEGRPRQAHRVFFERAHGPIPEGAFICHTCDVPRCVNPDHLYAGDAKSNSADAVDRGRSARGERNAQSKLTQDQVDAIRASYTGAWGEISALSREYGLSIARVSVILRGDAWSASSGASLRPRAKLSWDQVVALRAEATGERGEGVRLGRKYGISSAQARLIVRGNARIHS